MKKRFLISLSLLLLLCSCGHRQLTVVEEMAQFRDTLLDRGLYYVCYEPNDSQCRALYAKMHKLDYDSPEYEILRLQIDSILRCYLYYDTTKKEVDYRKDVNGNFFTRDLLSNNIQEDENKGYYIDERQWYDEDYEYDYESYEDPFNDLYELIVDINNTPVVNDLVDYFKNIPTGVLYPEAEKDEGIHAGNVDSIDRPYFENNLRQLQAYIDKKLNKFPLEIIDYVKSNEWRKSALYNHTGDIIDVYYSYIFQYRLVQQIAYYCPYIELITDDISEDKQIAIAYWGFNGCDGNTYVFLKHNNGLYTVDVIDGGYCELETNDTTEGEPIYSVIHGASYVIRYFYDGNKWHRTDI